ncbi:MAG: metalloprotease family protein [Chloroflexota bacterium]|nr:metalloprotease family protein [Chloroflexota bacterium]
MNFLIRLYGVPHEALHVVALWLIGRRALRATRTHVDIPDDLTTRQYVFVAGLPALFFGGIALVALIGVLNAATLGQTALGMIGVTLAGLGFAGTMGDIQLIMARLMDEEHG